MYWRFAPSKRYGPKLQGADLHRNPTPGPADQKYLYGHIWVTVALLVRHRLWGAIGLPLRAMLYVRQRTMASIPKKYHWRFQTKLQLAAKLIGWLASILHAGGKRVWAVVDGGYAKRPFLKPAVKAGRPARDSAPFNGRSPFFSLWPVASCFDLSTDPARTPPWASRGGSSATVVRHTEFTILGDVTMLKAQFRPEQVTAVVDTREQSPLDLSPLRTIRKTLVAGDYSILGLESIVSVERKSLMDLVACTGAERGRFAREVRRLLGYPVRALVVEATWQQVEAGRWRSRTKPSAVIGSLLGWMSSGLPVILAGDHRRAGQFVSRLLFISARRRWEEARALCNGIQDLTIDES